MTRIEKVDIDNIQQVNGIKTKNKKRYTKPSSKNWIKVEQKHIRDRLSILFNSMKASQENCKTNYLLKI